MFSEGFFSALIFPMTPWSSEQILWADVGTSEYPPSGSFSPYRGRLPRVVGGATGTFTRRMTFLGGGGAVSSVTGESVGVTALELAAARDFEL